MSLRLSTGPVTPRRESEDAFSTFPQGGSDRAGIVGAGSPNHSLEGESKASSPSVGRKAAPKNLSRGLLRLDEHPKGARLLRR